MLSVLVCHSVGGCSRCYRLGLCHRFPPPGSPGPSSPQTAKFKLREGKQPQVPGDHDRDGFRQGAWLLLWGPHLASSTMESSHMRVTWGMHGAPTLSTVGVTMSSQSAGPGVDSGVIGGADCRLVFRLCTEQAPCSFLWDA